MNPTNFSFLEQDYPILFNVGCSAEYNLYEDPVICLVKLRQFIERMTEVIYDEHCLGFPNQNTIYNRINDLNYRGILPDNIENLFQAIRNKGNTAVHQIQGTVDEAKSGIYAAFRLSKWLYQTYSTEQDISGIRFKMPPNLDARHALNELEKNYKDLEAKFQQLLEERSTEGLPEEQEKAIISRSNAVARKVDMTEAETREIIDRQLRQAGWEADTTNINFKSKQSLPERGKNKAIAEWRCGRKWADYALFIGTELYAIVEAKKYGTDISSDLSQSKMYAELIEAKNEAKLLGKWRNYKAPFLFACNGREFLEQIKTKSGIWFLDARKERNRARALRGWHSPEGLKKLYLQNIDDANAKLKNDDSSFLSSKDGLGLRSYQLEAIRKVEEKIVQDHNSRRALLAMATGTGKTRTINGLCYRLIKSNRFKRILFLVDRRLLALQAFNSFQDNKVEDLNTFSEIYETKGLKDQIPDIDTRLHFATVQSMVKRLFYGKEDQTPIPVDTYDCIIVDEAHRGYLLDREMDEEELEFKNQMDYVSKYRMVLDYFDAHCIGLTATPAQHTSDIFGKPVFMYSYREAVIDGYLIDHEPPFLIKTQLNQEGIKWNKGEKPKVYDKESNSIEELSELEDEVLIEVDGFNKKVITESFNRTVIQQLVQEIDPEGEEKTLIFAARDTHADMIVQFLKEEYENIGVDVSDEAIMKITGRVHDPQGQVRKFKNEKFPNIVVTVDLLTTGIDVPSITNLVFMRRVGSRILYEQMLGRATRLCPAINKDVFRIYDAVGIYAALEKVTNMRPVAPNPKTTFEQLADEMNHIQSPERQQQQVEQIIAKIQRKKQLVQNDKSEQFEHLAKGHDPDDFIRILRNLPPKDTANFVMQHGGLWKFLDELRPEPRRQFYSEHQDKFLVMERGYGDYEKPEDYLLSFEQFLTENRNKIEAIRLVCTKPKALSRKALKELRLELDTAGFNTKALHTAWKNAKNEDIAADIITYIRTLSLGSALVSHEERIQNAVQQVRAMKNWNRIQERWIDRFEKQLLEESILQKDDLDQAPFLEAGGFNRLDKIFENDLENILNIINDHLYVA